MKTLLRVLRCLLLWQPVLAISAGLGLMLILATPVVAVVADAHTAFGASIYGYALALGFPYLAACVPFRNLIASRRLALVPGFHLHAGLALFALTALVALCVPASSRLYWPELLSPLFGLRVFIIASLYMGVMQLLLPTRHLIWAISLGPLAMLILLTQFGATLRPLLIDPAFTYALFVLSLVLWVCALRHLATHNDYRPLAKMPMNNTEYMWNPVPGSLLFLQRGRSSSPGRTLLLGYPDGLLSRLVYILYLVVVSPLVCVALLYVVGGDGENAATQNPAALFLLFSLVMTIISSMSTGEMAARCRLLWLRHGGSRDEHWHYLERTLLTNAALTFALIFIIAAGMALFSPALPLSPLDYLLGGSSCYLLGAYASLTERISNWSIWLQILLICILGPGVALAFNQDLVAIPVLSLFILLVALGFRRIAQRRFTAINWYQVKPRGAGFAWGAVRK